MIRRATAILLAALLVGCAASRIESKRSEYLAQNDVSPEVASAVEDGRVVEGMGFDAVIASLGKYDRRNKTVMGRSAQVQLVYEVGQYRQAFVYLDGSGRVTGWQNVCLLPYSCR